MNNIALVHCADDKQRRQYYPELCREAEEKPNGSIAKEYNKYMANIGLVKLDTAHYKNIAFDVMCCSCLPWELERYFGTYLNSLRKQLYRMSHHESWKKPVVVTLAWWARYSKVAAEVLGDLATVIDGRTATAYRLIQQIECSISWYKVGCIGYGEQAKLVETMRGELFDEIYDKYNVKDNTCPSVGSLLARCDVVLSTVSSRHTYRGDIPEYVTIIDDSWPRYFMNEEKKNE